MEQEQERQEWHKRLQSELAKVATRYHEFVDVHNTISNKNPDLQLADGKNEKKIQSGLGTIFGRLHRGFLGVLEHLQELQSANPSDIDLSIITHISEMIMTATLLGLQKESLVEHIAQGANIQQALHISEESINALYGAGKYFYEHQFHEESAVIFTLLSLIKPVEPLFWLLLGNSEYFQARYKAALVAYALATQVDPTNPQYHIFSAKCHKSLGNKSGAMASLHLAELAPESIEERMSLKITLRPIMQEIERMQ